MSRNAISTGNKYGNNYGRENDNGLNARDNYRNNNYPSMQNSNSTSQLQKVIKPNTLSKDRLKTKDIDEMTRNITDELDVLQNNLNNKKNQMSKNLNSRTFDSGDEGYMSNARQPIGSNVRPNIGGPSNKFGGVPRTEDKLNDFASNNSDFGTENFPTRIPKNTLNRDTSPSNAGAPKSGLFSNGLYLNEQKNSSQQLLIPTYQDSGYKEQAYSNTNKGIVSNGGGLKKNPFEGQSQLLDGGFGKSKATIGNNYNKYYDEPTDTSVSKVFSKPNLKKVPVKPKEEPLEEEEYIPPKNVKSVETKKAPSSNNESEPRRKPQGSINPLEEVPISKLKGNGGQIPDEDMDVDLIPCPEGCGRKFKEEALEKHIKACKTVFQTKRKKFDSAAARKTDEQMQLEMKPRKNQPASKLPPKKPQATQQQGQQPKWKSQSEALRAGMRAARGETLNQEEQMALKAQTQNDMIECPNCQRTFNEKAAERHLPFCASKSKVNAMKNTGKPGVASKGPAKKY